MKTIIEWWNLRKLITRLTILESLSKGDKSGLQIIEDINPLLLTSLFWSGKVYFLLHEMERVGILKSYNVDAALLLRGGRPRRVYKIILDLYKYPPGGNQL